MKIFIENIKSDIPPAHNGKGKFVYRLAKAIRSLGYDIVDNAQSCDINFRTNALPSSNHGKLVVRLDDVCYSLEAMHVRNNLRGGNNQLRTAIQNANGIIYQSSVSQKMCENALGVKNKMSALIPNGVDPDDFKPQSINLPGRKNYVMACQFLHPLRRLSDFMECWDRFVENKHDAFFHLIYGDCIGNLPSLNHKNMKIFPLMSQSKLNDFVHSCDATILLKFQDSCPNFAAESLACDTSLIVSNTNGILDSIGEEHAIIVPVDGPYQFGMCKWKVPPFYNGDSLIEALEAIYQNDKYIFNFPPSLHIENVASRYIQFFEEVL